MKENRGASRRRQGEPGGRRDARGRGRGGRTERGGPRGASDHQRRPPGVPLPRSAGTPAGKGAVQAGVPSGDKVGQTRRAGGWAVR